MFLKTESFEHNGVTVTLSELSALQRIEHLALMKRQAEQAESDSNRKFTVEDAIRTGAFLEPETGRTKYGGVPEWPKGTDCKSAAFRFDGSNPSSPRRILAHMEQGFFSLRWSKIMGAISVFTTV